MVRAEPPMLPAMGRRFAIMLKCSQTCMQASQHTPQELFCISCSLGFADSSLSGHTVAAHYTLQCPGRGPSCRRSGCRVQGG